MTLAIALDYEAIFYSLSAPVFVCDKDGRILTVNPAAEKLFGYSLIELQHQPLGTLMNGTAPEVGRRKDGSEFSATAVVGKTVNDQDIYTVTVIDTTGEQNAMQELDEFASIVSHDLQQQTRNITNYVELIEKYSATNTAEQVSSYLEVINISSHKLNDLLAVLLAYSRIGKKKQYEKVDCNNLLETVLAELKEDIIITKAIITVDNLPVVWGNAEELRIVFVELLRNALLFKLPGSVPVVTIASYTAGSSTTFIIKDNGIGIAEKNRSKIFRMFQRLHAEDEYSGNGAGLALTKRIIRSHGGNIRVEGAPGTGSSFYFSIPQA